jgi:hypothetical protein
MKFLSSGGLGDYWIALLKILDCQPEFIESTHLTRHQEHVEPITQLMSLLPNITHAKCFKVTRDTKPFAEESVMSQGDVIRLTSKASDIRNSILNCLPFKSIYENEYGDYAVIQPIAGRSITNEDPNALRKFMPYAVSSLIEYFTKKGLRTMLLGKPYEIATPRGILDMTGKTTVKQAIELVKNAKYFVGYDGFLAYVSMSFGVPSAVIFHDPRIVDHYMHPKWREKTNVLVGSQRISGEIHNIIEIMESNNG